MRVLLLTVLCGLCAIVCSRNALRESVTAPSAAHIRRVETIVGQKTSAREEMDFQMCWEWATSEPQAAATFATGLPESEERDQWLFVIANEWARSDAGAAIAWARTHLASKARDSFISVV